MQLHKEMIEIIYSYLRPKDKIRLALTCKDVFNTLPSDEYHYIRNYQRVLSDILQIKHFDRSTIVLSSLFIYPHRLVEYGIWLHSQGTSLRNSTRFYVYAPGCTIIISRRYYHKRHIFRCKCKRIEADSRQFRIFEYDQLELIKKICNERKIEYEPTI